MWEQSGLTFMLRLMEGAVTSYAPQFVLFKDNLVGVAGNHTLDEAKICDFPGHTGIGLVYAAVPSIDGAGKGTAETNPLTWTRTTTGTVQSVVGIGLISNAPGSSPELMWYDDGFSSVNLDTAGDQFERVVKFGDDNLVVTP